MNYLNQKGDLQKPSFFDKKHTGDMFFIDNLKGGKTMCSCCYFLDIKNIGLVAEEKREKEEKSRLLFLLDKSSEKGLTSKEIDEAEELIKSTPETGVECRMKIIHEPHEGAIGDTGLCRACCEFRLHNVLPQAEMAKK